MKSIVSKYGLKLIGAGYALPERIITSEELESMMEFEKFGIRKGMSKLLSGVSERRFAEGDEDSSDYAVRAGKMALENANMKPEDIDLLMFCSITSDFMEPATAMKVRSEIGCVNANCYDVKNACNGLLTGLEIANMYVETGRAKNILLVAGEVLSRFLKMKYETVEEIEGANATFSIGDAGGALVVTAVEIQSEKDVMRSIFKTVSDYWHDGIMWGGGTKYAHNPEMAYFQNESKEMMKTNFSRAMEFYASAMKELNISIEDVDLFVPHQITKFLTLKTCEILGLPKEKTVDQIGKLGNNGCASIPIAIAKSIENGTLEMGSGQHVLLLGFGNGVSMALFSLYI